MRITFIIIYNSKETISTINYKFKNKQTIMQSTFKT